MDLDGRSSVVYRLQVQVTSTSYKYKLQVLQSYSTPQVGFWLRSRLPSRISPLPLPLLSPSSLISHPSSLVSHLVIIKSITRATLLGDHDFIDLLSTDYETSDKPPSCHFSFLIPLYFRFCHIIQRQVHQIVPNKTNENLPPSTFHLFHFNSHFFFRHDLMNSHSCERPVGRCWQFTRLVDSQSSWLRWIEWGGL